ncbi:MAG: hypothetical protein VX830_04365 [Candidatus Poribacteria bacterium]|nr:hypothetical protein [Candidatus Poribacteria bacterium]
MKKYSCLVALLLFGLGCGTSDESMTKETDVESLRQDIRSLKREMKKEMEELKTLLASNIEQPPPVVEASQQTKPDQPPVDGGNRANSAPKITRMGEIAIFNESVGWTNLAAAKADTEKILRTKFAKRVKVYNDRDIGTFAKKRTGNTQLDIIITFGYFPVSLYEPGNTQKEDSIAEKFLEGGDIFINTADYIFYVTKGGGKNGDKGLKTITDSNFDCWGDESPFAPTADGKKYVPSLPADYISQRPMKKSQIDADDNWEIEISFGSNGDDNHDPVVVKSTKHGGRFVIVRQTPAAAPDRGNVIREILENYVNKRIVPALLSVEKKNKLAIIWAETKKF